MGLVRVSMASSIAVVICAVTMVSFLAVAAAEDILCFCFLCVVVMAVGVVSITDNAAADKLDARGGAKSTRKRFGYCIVRIVR